MSRLIDVTGQKFGRLAVKRKADNIILPSGVVKTVWECVWECVCDCGVITLVPSHHLRSGRTKSCGCFRREFLRSRNGPKSSNWKGGRNLHLGYIYLKSPKHPFANKGYVFKHRLIMEQFIGRYLAPNETIHH